MEFCHEPKTSSIKDPNMKQFLNHILALLNIETLKSKDHFEQIQKMEIETKEDTKSSEDVTTDDKNNTAKNQPESASKYKNEEGEEKQNSYFPFTAHCAGFMASLLTYRYYDSKKFSDCLDLCLKIIKIGASLPRLHTEKAYFLYALSHEKMGTLSQQRAFLQQQLSLVSKRMHTESMAVIINALLRSFLKDKLYTSADKFVAKITFPEDAHSNQWARYHFYIGQIRAYQAEYGQAVSHLTEASRKCPQESSHDFQLIALKNLLIVTLLSGEMPEKSLFSKQYIFKALKPYFGLVESVSHGKMSKFNETVQQYEKLFMRDGLLSLISRLPFNVRKMCLKLIAKSYSQIELKDVAARLELEDPSDVEYVIQNAITNGVIDADITNDGIMQSKSEINIYETTIPQQNFSERLDFCLKLYEKSLQALKHLPSNADRSSDSEDESQDEENQFDMDMLNRLSDIGEDF